MSVDERKEQIVTVALEVFAETGYAGTGTRAIARRAGVSQPYLIRLFGTKRDVFLAATHCVWDRLERSLRTASRDDVSTETVFAAEYEILPLLLHGFAACYDPVVGDVMRHRFGRFHELARSLMDEEALDLANRFVADTMLLSILSAMHCSGETETVCTSTRIASPEPDRRQGSNSGDA